MEIYERLEEELAKWVSVPREGMVVCASGTAALHLAFEALQLPPGAEVICPDFTMIACPRAIAAAGLTPVFVDCGEDGLAGMKEVESLCRGEAIIGEGGGYTGTNHIYDKALLAVHIYGRRVNMEPIHTWAEKWICLDYRSAPVIEDMAELHGVSPSPRSDAACWSFYRNKVVAGEEGGAVWFRDPARAEVARELRSLGFKHEPKGESGISYHDYKHRPRGWNHRLSNAHAGLILDSLRRFPENCRERRRCEIVYDRAFPNEWKMPPRDKVWVYDLRLRGLVERQAEKIVRALQAEGIAARHAFAPMSIQEEFKNCKMLKRSEGESVSTVLAREMIYLPAVGVTEQYALTCREIIERCLTT